MSRDLPVWCAPPGNDLHWRHWDGNVVVYNASSANAHVLDPISAEVLRELQEPQTDADVAVRLAARLPDASGITAERVAASISLLSQAGLVERSPA
jgi:hypothetical protein